MEKILFRIRGLGIGGIERLALDILNNLYIPDKEIILLLENRNENELEGQLNENIKKIYLLPKLFEKIFLKIKTEKQKNRNLLLRSIYGVLLEVKKLLIKSTINKIIKKEKVKLFIDYSGNSMSNIHKIKNVKKILWLHMTVANMTLKKQKKYIKKLARYNKIVVICDEMEKELLKIAPELKNKVKKIYNFIDKELIEIKMDKKNIEENDKELLKENYCMMLGRLVKIKDYKTAIQSFKLLSERGIKEKLYIIGSGPEKEKLIKIIKKFQLEKQVFLLGARENPYPLLKKADIFIHTSLKEGFGLVLTEAAVCKVPVISTKYECGAKELLENGENGILIEKGDYRELAIKIEELLNNKILRDNYVKNFNISLERFDKTKILNQYKELLIEVSNEK